MPLTLKPATLRYKDENGVYKTADCLKGDPGGIPAGGTAGQYLKKVSGTDYDAGWVTLIADNLTTNDATKALSAKQGYTLNNKTANPFNGTATVISSNLDNEITVGMVQYNPSTSNIPTANTYGICYIVSTNKSDDNNKWIWQIAYNTSDYKNVSIRHKRASNAWTSWYSLYNQIERVGELYNTSITVTATGDTALKRIHNQWSNIISAIKTAHGLTTSSGMVNIMGRAEFPANGTASNLGTYFYWGALNCSNGYGTMHLYQYHNSPLYIYRNHGTTADGSTVDETAADIT